MQLSLAKTVVLPACCCHCQSFLSFWCLSSCHADCCLSQADQPMKGLRHPTLVVGCAAEHWWTSCSPAVMSGSSAQQSGAFHLLWGMGAATQDVTEVSGYYVSTCDYSIQTSLQSESVFRASLFQQKPGTRLQVVWLTTRCWNSQDRMTLVACLGRTPRFCFFLLLRKSSSSSIDPGVVGAGDSWPATNIKQNLAHNETAVVPSCCY